MLEFFGFLVKVVLFIQVTPWMTRTSGWCLFLILRDSAFFHLGPTNNLVVRRDSLFRTIYPASIEDVACILVFCPGQLSNTLTSSRTRRPALLSALETLPISSSSSFPA
jgi:hypothetical protein